VTTDGFALYISAYVVCWFTSHLIILFPTKQYWYPDDTENCVERRNCLWNPALKTEEECIAGDPMFCGYCETENCVVVCNSIVKSQPAPVLITFFLQLDAAKDKNTCESYYACFHADGSTTFTQSKEECWNEYSCTQVTMINQSLISSYIHSLSFSLVIMECAPTRQIARSPVVSAQLSIFSYTFNRHMICPGL